MSQEETQKYFDWERQKHFDFFLPYYQERNWQVIEDNINGNKPMDWDVKVELSVGKYALIDEKARQGNYSDFLVEIIQDMKTGKLGWLYSKKDLILYGSWIDLDSSYPISLYVISSQELKNYIYGLDGFIKTCISKKGWGNTWNIVLNWNELINKNIAKKLI